MVYVTNGANVDMGFGAFELCFRHGYYLRALPNVS
jgi:hypothetical protein